MGRELTATSSDAVKGSVPLDGDSAGEAAVGVVVPHGVALGAAVVPEGDGVRLPLKSTLELRLLGAG